jgi:hypothetical protein
MNYVAAAFPARDWPPDHAGSGQLGEGACARTLKLAEDPLDADTPPINTIKPGPSRVCEER